MGLATIGAQVRRLDPSYALFLRDTFGEPGSLCQPHLCSYSAQCSPIQDRLNPNSLEVTVSEEERLGRRAWRGRIEGYVPLTRIVSNLNL